MLDAMNFSAVYKKGSQLWALEKNLQTTNVDWVPEARMQLQIPNI